MSPETTKTGRPSARIKRVLLGGVFALALGGIVAGEAVMLPDTSAQAQNLTAEINQPLSFADVVERVQPAVVSIRVKADEGVQQSRMEGMQGMPDIPQDSPLYDFFRRFGQPGMPGMPGQGGDGDGKRPHQYALAQGSGFFITGDGYAVTNNHVVENAEEVTVVMNDGKEYPAKVIGTDPKTDLALVKVDADREFPHVDFAKGDTRVGDWVVAVGNPFGLGGTVTAGIVSARGRDIGAGPYDDFIQIDASINKGNSGGPAFNLKGEVIGVNTAIYSPSGGSVGIGFAIPARTVETVVNDLKDDGKVVRGWLGVQIQPVTEDLAASIGLDAPKGALVTDPQADSPAKKAGIKAGDAILAVNGETVNDARDLAKRIAGYPPNTTVDVTVWRDGKTQDLKVELGTLPEERKQADAGSSAQPEKPASLEEYGLSLAPASQVGAGDEGVAVTSVDPDGKAADKGLREGDVILEVAGIAVEKPADVQASLREAAADGRKAVLLRVKNGDNVRFLALPLDRA